MSEHLGYGSQYRSSLFTMSLPKLKLHTKCGFAGPQEQTFSASLELQTTAPILVVRVEDIRAHLRCHANGGDIVDPRALANSTESGRFEEERGIRTHEFSAFLGV